MKDLDKIKRSITNHYSNQSEVIEFQGVVKDLNDGKWFNKQVMLQKMISYMAFNEKTINDLAKGLHLNQVNYKVLREQYDTMRTYYESVKTASKDVNDFLTDMGLKE